MSETYGPGVGALCALGSAFTWSLIGLLARVLSLAFNPVTINAVRTSVGGALLLAWVLLTGRAGKLTEVSPRNFGLLAVSIVVAGGVGDTAFFASTRSLGLARAMTISTTYPLIAALLAAALIGEPLTLRVAAGALLTATGLTLIVTARREETTRPGRFGVGLTAAALAALAWAVSVILLKAPLRDVDATTAQAIRLPLVGIILWATPWTRGVIGQFKRSGHTARRQMAWLGVLSAVSSVMFVAGLKYAGVGVASVLSSTSPLFATLLELLVLGQHLKPTAVLGSIITVAGITGLQL